MVVDYRDRVLGLMRVQGPLLPMHVAKEMRTNILMGSAMLSELSSKGAVKVSHIKVGGSPLYYLPGQEAMLLKFVSNLNEKDRQTLEHLQQRKVLRDTGLDALTRVSLRNIQDFALPLNVTHDGATELFWKWFQLPDEQATNMIKELVQPSPVQQSMQQGVVQPLQQPLQTQPKNLQQKRKRVSKPIEQTVLEDTSQHDLFFRQIQAFCAANRIKLLSHVLLKKKQECALVLEIPSPLGSLIYCAIARNKRKLTDADLNAAFVHGQLKKMPALLLAPGELSKAGQALLETDLRGVAFARML